MRPRPIRLVAIVLCTALATGFTGGASAVPITDIALCSLGYEDMLSITGDFQSTNEQNRAVVRQLVVEAQQERNLVVLNCLDGRLCRIDGWISPSSRS